MERHRPEIVIVGAGNVAYHLAGCMDECATVRQIWSRNIGNAKAIAQHLRNAEAIDDISAVTTSADYYIIAVPDDAISTVAKKLPHVGGTILHTSGSTDIKVIKDSLPWAESYGVLYPLQTFSKISRKTIEFRNIPLFIEGNSEQTETHIKILADLISDKVFMADSSVRRHLHVAAVFANNFTNHMWDIADHYLREHTDMDFSIFESLLKESLAKAIETSPHEAQTGPAVRNDRLVIDKHVSLLTEETATLYKLISDHIIKSFHHSDNE